MNGPDDWARCFDRKAAFFILIFIATNSLLLFLFPFSIRRFLVCAVLYAAGTILMLYLLFHPRSNYLVPARTRVNVEGKPCVALTFDDGPNGQHTLTLIRLLREKQIHATFFLVGRRASENPDLVRLMLSDGNQVGNHTYSHPALFCFLSPRRLQKEIERCQEAIREACGIAPRHFRSPVGLRHPLLRKCLVPAGLEFISWRARAFDSRKQDPEKLARKILKNIAPGDIILLHDKPGEATGKMLEALPRIVDELKRRGFEFVLV